MGKSNSIEWHGQTVDTGLILQVDSRISAKNVVALTRCLLAYFDEFSAGHQCGVIDGPILEIKDDIQRIARVLFSDHFERMDKIQEDHEAIMRQQLPTKPSIPKHLRKAVFERDGFRCLKCGSQWELCADHIHPEWPNRRPNTAS